MAESHSLEPAFSIPVREKTAMLPEYGTGFRLYSTSQSFMITVPIAR